MRSKTLKVDYLARVEGEGSLYVKMKDGVVKDVNFKIFEPPRFFEAFLRGRHYSEAPDITARICGICPVAYQMSSVTAMESAFDVNVDGQLHALRRLLYCGEWIESHALHIYLLHAPDFLGYADAIRMAEVYPEAVKRGLRLKKTGNDVVSVIGGREIHPINVRVGGFYKVPTKTELQSLIDPLRWARDAALETVEWTSTLEFPEFECDYEFVALRHPDEYPLMEGRLISNKGLDIAVNEYENHFVEEHVRRSNALHSVLNDRRSYLVGPLARYNLNFNRLPSSAQQAARSAGIEPPCINPFKGIVVRSVEMVFACEEALRVIDAYEEPERPFVAVNPRAGVGYGCTEAPRGILYHRYHVHENGTILDAKIVPPTAQNQKIMESDLAQFVSKYSSLPVDHLTRQCEQAIRNYDPCISCATHFLKLNIEREENDVHLNHHEDHNS